MALQRRLDVLYHGEKYFRDRLLNVTDILYIQQAHRDKMTRSSQKAVNIIGNRLSEKHGSTGSVSVLYTADFNSDQSDVGEYPYTHGQTFGGQARRSPKPYRQKGKRTVNHHGNQNRPQGPRLRSSWLKGVTGCFVCGKRIWPIKTPKRRSTGGETKHKR